MTRFRVGIDTGGTFTDIVAIDEKSGRIATTKTSSTPNDPSTALVRGLEKVLSQVGADRSAVESLIHGTTVATNALLEERFGSLALITTAGFRHILEIARQSVPSGYGNSYFWVKPDRIVPLDRVFEVSERLNYRGEVLKPLDEDGVREIGHLLAQLGVRAAAISLIHAYANGDHERRIRDLLWEKNPELILSLSSEVLPEYREYERTVTTCIDAYVKPVVERYIGQAVTRLGHKDGGATRSAHDFPFLIMQSNGGVLSAHEVAKQPITTLLSGPAAGALGASYLAGLSGYEHVLTVDAGGTSTDICLVDGGAPYITTAGSVGRFPVKLPIVDITTIGTGGGSIAWVDPSGGLRVGPRSAGSDPGPICYGRGGDDVTLTDANVFLGRLPDVLLGGEMSLDGEASRRGLAALATQLNLSIDRLAAGIVEIADWNQVNAIRQVTVKKGLDPRRYTMVAFGGSGPLQAPHVAELLGMKTVVIPTDPGNVSAFGLLAVDLKTDYVATFVQREDRLNLAPLNDRFAALEERARQGLALEGVAPNRCRLVRTIDVRYFGEAYELSVPAPEGPLDETAVDEVIHRFHQEHIRLYGYSYVGQQLCEFVNIRVEAIGLVDRPTVTLNDAEIDGHALTAMDTRKLFINETGFQNVPVFDRESLARHHPLSGPCVIQEFGSTTVVPPGWSAHAEEHCNLILCRQDC